MYTCEEQDIVSLVDSICEVWGGARNPDLLSR